MSKNSSVWARVFTISPLRSRSFLYGASAIIRLILLVFAEWQDRNFAVKYTDVDYMVFTDAARYLYGGQSPYLRSTYRYTPLVAILMLPSVAIHFVCGKLLFVFTDLLVGYLIEKIMALRSKNATNEVVSNTVPYAAIWLLNPLAINVSTRGSADTIISAMVLATMYLVMKRRLVFAGIVFGLAVHFKIYPIIYSISFLVYLAQGNLRVWKDSHLLRELIVFSLTSASTFFFLTGLFYYIYGHDFLWDGLLYHLGRTDHRHNFSMYFYPIYLHHGSPFLATFGKILLLPQAFLLLVTSVAFGANLPYCLLLQTFLFVTFNKVCTAQYFTWYISLLPPALPSLQMPRSLAFSLGLCWVASLGTWLYFAHALEFRGINTFFEIWLASIAFFLANVAVLTFSIANYEGASGSSKGGEHKAK